jgi:hypothetical protein
MCVYPSKYMCANCQGLKLTLTTQTLLWWLFIEKQHTFSCITNHLTVPFHLFCNHICLSQELHTTKNHAVWCSGSSDPAHRCLLKSRVHTEAKWTMCRHWHRSNSTLYENYHLEPCLTVANDGTHTLKFSLTPPSVAPLCFYTQEIHELL